MVKETAAEDVDDPERGREAAPKPSFDLTPSSKGRQRKINSRYFDYDTGDANEDPGDDDVPARKVVAPTSGKTTGKRGRPRKVPLASTDTSHQTPDALNGDTSSQTNAGVTDCDTSDANEQPKDAAAREPATKAAAAATPVKTPGKRGRPRKVPLASGDDFKTPQALNGDISPQTNASPSPCTENGTPKPKRKYVKKQFFHMEPVTPREKSPEESQELQQGGRPRRSAAKMAMKFLHAMAQEEVSRPSEGPEAAGGVIAKPAAETTAESSSQAKKGRRGRKRKSSDGDAAEDEDFVPNVGTSETEEEEEGEEEEEEEEEGEDDQEVADSDSHDESSVPRNARLTNLPLVEIVNNHKTFRDEQLCGWVFPEWLPSAGVWHRVPPSELETYLPQECLSAAFKVSRDGCGEERPLQRLNRFESLPAHPERWDMQLYTGGPVWAMEWCPTPDNAVASQYLALACRRDMQEEHYFHKTYSGPGLVQLWDVGTLDYDTTPSSKPALAYGLALDRGFICHLKWCPSGGWESPATQKEAPLLPRLGLLAVATSAGAVTIYSLPHPDALRASQDHQDSAGTDQPTVIYKPNPVVTLKPGSLKALRLERSGQVLSMDWLPIKPHDVIAVGFYDGMVGLWDLNTKSALLRLQESHDYPSLLPYKCFLAHGQGVRALAFCASSRHLVATAGEDRFVKTWDLRRLYGPITVQKRSLINEICWPTNAPGLLFSQDSAFAACGTNGVHYFDHQMKSYFAVPRTTTIWSISYSDWLNALATSDVIGEVILSALPSLSANTQHIKKTIKKRFPVYFTSMERHAAAEVKEQEQEVCQEELKEKNDGEDGGGGGSGEKADVHPPAFDTYKETERKYYLHHSDNNMELFIKRGRMWKKMRDTEFRTRLNMDEMALASVHKAAPVEAFDVFSWNKR
ncbi:general transcription factor 3C polypeptide 2 isoform X2 [Syngnathoides biaculeatus]|uniref:general transcription factor 3C polypeptide 2 isoform X2 n=1 Tax=Syngnathoides biaculeatus TaxID=300417 RepID=UPI002ADDD667|nr:general transcription factor 3C polypeptide 2 isoform X2 [Syngnathoides biaculeatus]